MAKINKKQQNYTKKKLYRIIIPPYSKFGSEEDCLGNCLRLVNDPKKDYYKYIDNDKLILRFLARLNNKELEDVNIRTSKMI